MLLKGGYIVNSDRKYLSDVLIEKNLIQQIGVNLIASNDVKVVNIAKMLIMPGGIDPSTNFNLNSDKKESLKKDSCLALEGGTTTIINKFTTSDESSSSNGLQTQSTQMKKDMYCNFGFYATLDVESKNCLKDMKDLVESSGVNCFEINITSKVNKNVISVMKQCTELGCLLRIRIEDRIFQEMLEQSLIDDGIKGPDGFIQSRLLEDEIGSLYEVLKLNSLCPSAVFIPQVTSTHVASIIGDMKKKGHAIFCETITAALAVDGERYLLNNWEEAAAVVTEPPLRTGQTNKLVKSLQCGDVDMLASQHTSISLMERAKGQRDFRDIPRGVSGVRERMTVLWDRGVGTGLIDECQFVAVTSTNAAKLFNLYPKRGCIAVGNIADLVIWNPEKNVHISVNGQGTSDINIFEGLSCKGAPEIVILNGEIKYENCSIIEPPSGEKTELKNNCRMLQDKIKSCHKRKDLSKVVVEHEYKCPLNVLDQENNDTISANLTEDKNVNNRGLTAKSQRPPTSSGHRNMQDSSFAFSGAQIDDDRPNRSSIRTNQPPGGKSSQFW